MFRADAAASAYAAGIAAARDEIALPLNAPASTQTGGAGFASMMGSVRDEVQHFIAKGSQELELSAAGQVWRARLQNAAVDEEGERTATLKTAALRAVERATASGLAVEGMAGHQQAFLGRIAPWAREAGRRLGVAPEIVAAQAALESGWGQRPLRGDDGRETHNLFGIKAGSSWQGATVEAQTTEFEEGVAVRRAERFRSYPTPASAFRDFAALLADNPRYRGALNAGGDARAYAEGLAQGGYATDPDYADKLVSIARRLQRAD